MSKCIHCQQRKGKRPCPALNGNICSPCCGTHRVVSIPCPSDCIFLNANLEYQQKRAGDRFEQDRRMFYRELMELEGERAVEIFYVFGALTFRHFHARRDAQDAEVIAGIQALRRSFSPIHVPEPAPAAFGEELKKEYKVLGERQTLNPDLTTEILDRAIQFISQFSGGGLRSTRFLSGLIGYVKHQHPDVAKQLARQSGAGGRIIIPSGVAAGKEEIPLHHH